MEFAKSVLILLTLPLVITLSLSVFALIGAIITVYFEFWFITIPVTIYVWSQNE